MSKKAGDDAPASMSKIIPATKKKTTASSTPKQKKKPVLLGGEDLFDGPAPSQKTPPTKKKKVRKAVPKEEDEEDDLFGPLTSKSKPKSPGPSDIEGQGQQEQAPIPVYQPPSQLDSDYLFSEPVKPVQQGKQDDIFGNISPPPQLVPGPQPVDDYLPAMAVSVAKPKQEEEPQGIFPDAPLTEKVGDATPPTSEPVNDLFAASPSNKMAPLKSVSVTVVAHLLML